jgi:hypothetical protein
MPENGPALATSKGVALAHRFLRYFLGPQLIALSFGATIAVFGIAAGSDTDSSSLLPFRCDNR